MSHLRYTTHDASDSAQQSGCALLPSIHLRRYCLEAQAATSRQSCDHASAADNKRQHEALAVAHPMCVMCEVPTVNGQLQLLVLWGAALLLDLACGWQGGCSLQHKRLQHDVPLGCSEGGCACAC